MPKVSIIIPTYKRANMLTRAIESVLTQSYRKLEIIVVDDNNPDSSYRKETSYIMTKYKDNSIVKYIKHEKNMNGAVARNTGIYHSTGDLITFLDDDDWYEKTKIEKQVNYLLENPNYKAVYCGCFREGGIYSPNLKGDLSFEVLSGIITIRTNTIMMWKDTIEDIGGWNEEFKRNQEAALLLRYFEKGYEIGSITESLVHYDLTDRSNALNPTENKKQFEFHLKYHEDIIKKLENKNKNARKVIYSRRYRSILFSYIKNKQFINAIKHYIESFTRYPYYFNLEIFKYIKEKTFKSNKV